MQLKVHIPRTFLKEAAFTVCLLGYSVDDIRNGLPVQWVKDAEPSRVCHRLESNTTDSRVLDTKFHYITYLVVVDTLVNSRYQDHIELGLS